MSEDQKTELEQAMENAQNKAKAENEKRSGVGTRIKVGATRGRNPQVITWEAFDENLPDTLPKDFQAFLDLAKPTEEQILQYVIAGYNDAQYTAASDPLAELLNDAWSAEVKLQFRTVVRNYARGAEVSLEEAAALVKPGFDKKFSAKTETPAQ